MCSAGAGRRVRLVHRHLEIERPIALHGAEMPVHGRHVRDGAAVLHGGLHQRALVDLHGLALDVEHAARQARAHGGRAVLEPVPRQGVPRLTQRPWGRGVGVPIHVLAGIQREHREAGGGARRDVLGRLEMIRVGALPRRPSRLETAPGRIVDHRLGRSRGARHLPDRLLGKDGRDGAAGGGQRPHMARRGEAEAIAEACRRRGRQRPRLEPRQVAPEGRGIPRREGPDQERLAAVFAALPVEVRQHAGPGGGRHDQQPRPRRRARHRPVGCSGGRTRGRMQIESEPVCGVRRARVSS